MANFLGEFISRLRQLIHMEIGDVIKASRLDEYTEVYDEAKQLWTMNLSFNEGDIRTLKIKLDINPDPEP